MPLTPGTRLGVYEILSVLGAGGMGEVYRARDSKLGREVAIKVILDVFAADPDRIARFEREAKVLASLNHPHIAALYGMEQSGGHHFLVMELVEGETLADRLRRGPMPPEEVLAVALQIAEALQAAHEKGVVHRDLKPANVKVTPDDRVKVLDFGLAKAIENDATASNIANSPTVSMMASQAGIVLGTAAYMSPEQAKGFPADHRSDVFSFGSVLYEMLAGRQPFHGDTAPEVLASVLVREADVTQLPADLNPRFVDLLRRCLQKQPKRRWQAIGDVHAELESIAAAPRMQPLAVQAVAPRRPLWRRMLPAVASALVVGALAAAAAWTLKPSPDAPVARFAFSLSAGERLSGPGRLMLAISPDGTEIVYVANSRLNLRRLSDMESKPIPGTESSQGPTSPVFSPDGLSVAFFSNEDQTLKKVAVTGGAPVTLCPASNPYGMSWGADGILFAQAGAGAETPGILRISENLGKPELVVPVKAGEWGQSPRMLPDGEHVLFTLATGTATERWDKAAIVVQSIRSGTRTVLVQGGSDGRYLPTGHLAYALGGTVFAVPFDARRLIVGHNPVPILAGVRRAAGAVTGSAQFVVSNTGVLVYFPGPASVSTIPVDLAIADRKGAITPLKLGPANYHFPRVSPDGTRVAFTIDDGKEEVVMVYDLSGASDMRRVTFGGRNRLAVWVDGGKRLAFQSDRDGDLAIFWQPADGTGTAERLTKPGAGESHTPLSWSSQHDVLLFEVSKGPTVTLWTLSLHDRKTAPFGGVQSRAPTGAVFSPDGRWVAYTSAEAGPGASGFNLFVQPFPATGAESQLVKNQPGSQHHPLWAPDSKEITYLSRPGGTETVGVTTTPTFAFGKRVAAGTAFLGSGPNSYREYDVTPDGGIVGTIVPGQTTTTENPDIQVVLNWFEELKARIPR